MVHIFLVGRHCRTCQHKLSHIMSMIHFKSNGIPKFRCQLPFVNKARRLTFEQDGRVNLCHLHISFQRGWIIHIQDALCLLFSSSSLATPLWSFYQYSPFACQLFREHFICYSMFVFHIFQIFDNQVQRYKNIFLYLPSWLNIISLVGDILYPLLAVYCFLSWLFVYHYYLQYLAFPLHQLDTKFYLISSPTVFLSRQNFSSFFLIIKHENPISSTLEETRKS